VRSVANADLAASYQRVVIVAPVAQGIGPIMPGPGRQAAALAAAGARVALVRPDRCVPRPAAATTPSNKRSGLSSGTDSGRSGFSGGAATSWNTRTWPQIQKPSRPQGQRTALSPPRAGCCPSWPSSAKTRS
jgi:hypothetical protein